MDSGVLPISDIGNEVRLRSIGQGARRLPRRAAESAGQGSDYAPPQSPAVVVAGAPAPARRAVVGELLGAGTPVLDVPDESYLVLRHGARRTARAYLPGSKQPQPYPAAAEGDDGTGDEDTGLARPPRRVELTLPASLLTSFAVVDTPVAGAFGPAYNRIVLDTAERGGALLVTLDTQVLPGQAELDFLVAAGRRPVAPFFAVWAQEADESTTTKMAAYRDVVASRVPRFADLPWFLVLPGSGAADLRQALADWAGEAARCTPGPEPARRRVKTAEDGHESGWPELLDRVITAAEHGVRQRLTIELANIHLRCVQDVVFGDAREPDRKHSGAGCAGMPAGLDREMHALSLRADAELAAAVTEATRHVLAHVLAEAPYDDVLRRVADALRRRVAEDGPDLHRILLITSTPGAVAAVSGAAATAALSAYHTPTSPDVLPPLGIGLSASCYKKWRDDPKADVEVARGWLQDAVRGTELELQRVLAERFDAVRQVLSGLVGDAVDHGLLLV